MPARGGQRAAGVALAVAVSLGAVAGSGCKRKHVPVDAVPELGIPTCGDAGDERGQAVAGGHIRSGPTSPESNVVERFELRKTSCGYTFRSRQEWPLAIADMEIRYDATLAPLWAYKRLTIAGSPRPDGNADVRRYELRTGDVFIKRRDPAGELMLEKLLPGGRASVPPGAKIEAIVAPGRGSITPWLQRARLPEGGKTRTLVLDFRDMVESLEEATLERSADQIEPNFGAGGTNGTKVRVYTFFGRETVFADEHNVVIGDLAGMRPSDALTTPEPPPLPEYGGPDPVHTP